MVDVPANATTMAVLETAILPGSGDLFGTYSGRIDAPGDHDWIRISLTAGKSYAFYLSAQHIGFPDGDSFLSLRNAAGAQVAFDDDSGVAFSSYLSFTATTTGTYYIDVYLPNPSARGTYSVLMTDSTFGANDFQTISDNTVIADSAEWLIGGPGDDTLNLLSNNGYAALGEQGDDFLVGSDLYDLLSGGLGSDQVDAHGGDDLVYGDAGDDRLSGLSGNDQLFGGDGFDDLFGGEGNDRLFGGADDDRLNGGSENDVLNGGAGNDVNLGGLGNDTLDGGSGDDTLNGDDGNDTVQGGIDNDALNGGAGIDFLTGGAGLDTMLGGADADRFDFNSKSESVKGGNRDRIMDFQRGTDRIDLRDVDAKTGVSGNQNFKWIGKDGFNDEKGELRYKDNGSTVIVQGDVNGDGKADFEIWVGVGALAKGDFIL